jgi:hypothetical protein
VTAGWDGRIKSFHNYGLPVADWCYSGTAVLQRIRIDPFFGIFSAPFDGITCHKIWCCVGDQLALSLTSLKVASLLYF